MIAFAIQHSLSLIQSHADGAQLHITNTHTRTPIIAGGTYQDYYNMIEGMRELLLKKNKKKKSARTPVDRADGRRGEAKRFVALRL
jgi:hypothetical protein